MTVECRQAGTDTWTAVHTEKLSTYAKVIKFDLDTSKFTTGNYEIRAYAKDSAGNTSEYKTVTYKFKECALSKPALTAAAGGWKVDLNWAMTNSEDLQGFNVYRRTSAADDYSVIARITGTSYTDTDVNPYTTYYYMVEAADNRNNRVQSNESTAKPTNEDGFAPVADAGFDKTGIEGKSIKFNGLNSSDNHCIESYEWDFGDGTTSASAKPSHVYEKSGTYSVTLTVKDSAGNLNSAKIQTTVYDKSYGSVDISVTNASGQKLAGAIVHAELPGVSETNFITDSDGKVTLAAKPGTYTVYFYQSGYLPTSKEITVSTDGNDEIVRLEKKELVTGEITVKTLDIAEIKALGIDVNAPENQAVYEFTVSGYWETTREQWRIITNSYGNVLHEYYSGSGNSGGTNTRSRQVKTYVKDKYVYVAYFQINTNISWLKEFYDVELTVTNNASEEFNIQNSTAKLNLPEGLSLAATKREENLVQNIGTISGQQTKTASWIVRGDKAGEYDLTANFSGVLMPFGEEVSFDFKTKDPLVVDSNNDALAINIVNDEWGITNDYWTTTFTATNISDRDLYNVTASFSGSTFNCEISDMELIYPDGTVIIVPWQAGKPDFNNKNVYLPALIEDENTNYMTLKPGQSIIGAFSVKKLV
jgi:PKD repeat protein